MTTDIILKLLDAGYTKKDIDLMQEMQPSQAADTEPVPEVHEAVTESDAAAPTAQPVEPEDDTRVNETLTQLLSVVGNLQKTVDAMQKNNAKAAESEQPQRLTADEVVRNFFGREKKA